MDAQVIIFYWFGYLFCAFVNNYVVMQLLCHRGHMHFHVQRNFHKGFSLDKIIKELLWCQKKKTGLGVINGFLQCLELNKLDAFLLIGVRVKLYNSI